MSGYQANEKQLEVFKHLIAEYYGWPDFSNINKAGDKVIENKDMTEKWIELVATRLRCEGITKTTRLIVL